MSANFFMICSVSSSAAAARNRDSVVRLCGQEPGMSHKTNWCAAVFTTTLFFPAFAQSIPTVRVDPSRIINSFDPDQAIGSSIDNLNQAAIDKVFTPHILQEALHAGYGPITYRNNSELRMLAWHWNDRGAWSDPENKSGYWTSSSE